MRDGRFVVHAAFVPSLVVCSEHDVDDVALLPRSRFWYNLPVRHAEEFPLLWACQCRGVVIRV